MHSTPALHPSLAHRGIALATFLVTLPLVPAAFSQTSVNSTLASNGGTAEWGNAATWANSSVPNATDAAISINGTVANNLILNLQTSGVNSTFTIGNLTYRDSSATFRDLTLQNGTINIATTSKSATWTHDSATGGAQALVNITASAAITAAADQALVLTNTNTPGTISATDVTGPAFRFNAAATWSGFNGTLTLGKGLFQANGSNSLPQNVPLTIGAGTDAAYLRIVTNQSHLISALTGNAQSFVFNTGTTLSTLSINSTLDGNFSGSVGTNGNASFSNAGINIAKNGSGAQTFGGVISGNGTVAVSGGTLVLAGNNTYTGATTINNGGTLRLGHANALGSTSVNTTLNGGGTLDLNGFSTGETITIGGGTLSNTSSTAGALTVDATVNGAFSVNNTGNITTARLIAGTSRTITKTGTGTLTTSGTSHNNLVAWDIQNGTVVLANTSGLGADRGVTLNGGTLRLSGSNSNLVNDGQSFTINTGTFDLNGKSEAVAAISGNGGFVTNTSASAATVFVGGGPGGNSSASFNGTIQNGVGVLSLTKEGSGTQTLTGTNTYTGATNVNGGSLVLSGGSLGNTTVTVGNSTFFTNNGSVAGSVVVNSGGTLNGSGSIGGNLTVNGAFAPGNSPGNSTIGGDLVLNSGSSTTMEIGGTNPGSGFDYVSVGGTVTWGGALSIVSYNSYDLDVAGSYNLFDFSAFTPASTSNFSSVSVAGTALNYGGSNIWSATNGGGTFTYSFSLADGVLTVAAVPEPSTFAALAGLAGLGVAACRRRRRD